MIDDLDPEELKEEGNIKWKNGEIDDANSLWRTALKECIKYSMRGMPTKKNRDMQMALRLNLSLYHFKKMEYADCINQCNIVLDNIPELNDIMNYYADDKKDGNNDTANLINDEQGEAKYDIKKDTLTKIFLRRASSYLFLQDFDKCRENIMLIKKIDKENGEAIYLEKKLKIEEIDYEKKQKELYRKMCDTTRRESIK
ncbi:conserved Plasmodium protein, unknown function [Plasmodium vinckei]|uniref:Tetratricopeptide repeat protein n=3 Tax=Plasmodium vinckei TaxID=5860 RepID=A0A6V7SM69_PLAVN|nr:conserved Plasmodium protein, unknown function [Plasmodium vinckei lentum]CAD2100260.1 conserved Plasmodium protein, unknown function [Plasmodium vinckei petteri]CAD2100308.1 conserved Plasmodium protein, unknown function [Plasmodium vinckei]